jgi:hypothetical protein
MWQRNRIGQVWSDVVICGQELSGIVIASSITDLLTTPDY